MDTQLLDAIRIIIRDEIQEALKPVYAKLQEHDDQFVHMHAQFVHMHAQFVHMHAQFANIHDQFKSIDYKFKRQDDKLDAMLEAWQIQKVHREELDDHEVRIQAIEHRIPVAS
jgi:chromosome segregation ATPase